MWTTLASHPWAYPALEVVHLVGIALLLGNLLLLELRLWGWAAPLPVAALARATLPLALAGFGLAAASGLVMAVSQADQLLTNRAFQLKLMLLMAAGTNAALFHARGAWTRGDGLSRLQTVLSLGLWLAVIICGRWIAYA